MTVSSNSTDACRAIIDAELSKVLGNMRLQKILGLKLLGITYTRLCTISPLNSGNIDILRAEDTWIELKSRLDEITERVTRESMRVMAKKTRASKVYCYTRHIPITYRNRAGMVGLTEPTRKNLASDTTTLGSASVLRLTSFVRMVGQSLAVTP